MEIIKIKPGTVFMMETEVALPDRQKLELMEEWKRMFPDNPLLICKKGTFKLIEVE